MDTNSVLKRLNINLSEFNHLRDKGIIQQTADDQYDQSHIESLYDEHKQTIKRRYFAYITDINPNFFDDLSTPNSVYVATVCKLQATVSETKDIFTLRHTPFNNLILKELGSTQTTTNLKFFSPSFIHSLNNFDLKTISPTFHRHMLRAIVEARFKVIKKSLQATFSTPNQTIPHIITHIAYHPHTKHHINTLHIRTTKALTCIRFKLYNTNNDLIDYLYPTIHPDDQTPYIHNPKMGEDITFFDQGY